MPLIVTGFKWHLMINEEITIKEDDESSNGKKHILPPTTFLFPPLKIDKVFQILENKTG